jgi:hypothetical protein
LDRLDPFAKLSANGRYLRIPSLTGPHRESPQRAEPSRPAACKGTVAEGATHRMRPQPRASQFLELVLQLFVDHLERISISSSPVSVSSVLLLGS